MILGVPDKRYTTYITPSQLKAVSTDHDTWYDAYSCRGNIMLQHLFLFVSVVYFRDTGGLGKGRKESHSSSLRKQQSMIEIFGLDVIQRIPFLLPPFLLAEHYSPMIVRGSRM